MNPIGSLKGKECVVPAIIAVPAKNHMEQETSTCPEQKLPHSRYSFPAMAAFLQPGEKAAIADLIPTPAKIRFANALERGKGGADKK